MKKLLALFLVVAMVLSLAACSDSGSTPSAPNSDAGTQESAPADGNTGVDMSKYPASLDDWSAQNIVDYFTEAGVFVEGHGLESWVQDHEYWIDTPFNEAAGYWDEEGLVMVWILTFDDSLPDVTTEEVNEMKDYMRKNKALPEDYTGLPIDHLVGNMAFSYMLTTDDDIYNAMDAAYNDLVAAMGVTPDF